MLAEGGEGSFDIRYPAYSENEIKENSLHLQKMGIVKALTGYESAKGNTKLSTMVLEYFDSLGNIIHSEQFGDVALTNTSMRSEIRHGLTSVKLRHLQLFQRLYRRAL